MLVAVAASSARAGAQERPDAGVAPDAVEPPRVTFDPGVAYPSDGRGQRVTVELMLELDADGAVVDASVVSEPRPGFDDAALVAAEQLRFEPARRGGVALPSRIGYRYAFEPPRPEPQPQVAPPPVAVAPERQAEPPASPIEVTVRGQRREPAAAAFTRGEVRQIPGAFGDPFRAVEILPGVTPIASGLPFFYVRGAPPGNVAYDLDGVRVPYLFHVGAGPAVVQPGLIREVELHPGGYPARFGRAAGGVVAASIVDPDPSPLHGEGTLRLFDVGGMAEAGFADERATVMLGGRYSYTGALLSLVAPEVTLDYRDFQARASYDVTPRDTLSVLSFGAYDFLKENDNALFASEFYRADLRYDHLHDRGHARVAVTLGYDRSSAVLLVPDDPRIMVDRSLALRTELSHELSSALTLRTGARAGLDFYGVEGAYYIDPDLPEAAQLARVFPARTDYDAGAWIDLSWTVGRFELTPGVRVDLYGSGSNEDLGVDPRLSARAHLSERVRLIAAGGIAHQPPSFVVPLPGLTPALGTGLQRSIQTSLGVEVDLDAATTTGGSLFFNLFDQLSDTFGTAGDDASQSYDLRSRGQAYGGELFLRRRLTKQLGGVLSYTLSRSLRWLGDRAFMSGFDRTHVLNAALSYDLGRRWRAGARLLYYTGTPKWSEDRDPVDVGTRDVPREPYYVRLDVRLEKRWIIGSDAWLSFVAEIMNATLNKETWPGGEEIGPITIPSIGLEAGF